MKNIELMFKSIRIRRVETINHGQRNEKKYTMEFDLNSIKDHHLEITIQQFLIDRSWIFNFFLTAMITFAFFSLIYGLLVIGFKINIFTGPGSLIRNIFCSALVLLFLVIWIVMAVPGVLKNKKNQLVENERGKDNWKIVDNKNWDKFYKLLTIPKKKPEKI